MSNISQLPVRKRPRPAPVNSNVTRKANSAYRSREHLTESEVEQMLTAISKISRYPVRDKTLILMAYRHGLRVKELLQLTWQDIDFTKARLNVRRVKNGLDTTHPIQGDTLRLLRQLKRSTEHDTFVFVTERGSPMTPSTVRHIVRRAGDESAIGLPVHPHMLRHGTGYHLANKGVDTRAIQEYLGHRNIEHTVRYTRLAAHRFDGFWK